MLKDVSSKDADWIRHLRIILIAAQKNYVLDAPLSDRPIAGADADVMNVWLAQYDDYLIVMCTMLYGLESGLQRCFEHHGPSPHDCYYHLLTYISLGTYKNKREATSRAIDLQHRYANTTRTKFMIN